MVDGKYQIVMQTPVGAMRGNLTMVTEGEKLSGVLEMMGNRHSFKGGKVQGEKCNFNSVIATAFGRINLEVQGVVQGNQLRATAKTPLGMITATGKRILEEKKK